MALNTKTSFSIAGQQFETFNTIELRQYINDHHEFEIYVSYDWFEKLGGGMSGAANKFLGEEAEIIIAPAEQLPGMKDLIFKGIVTNITTGKAGDGTHGHCIIRGHSPSILLNDDPHIAAYESKSLSDIVSATVKSYPPNVLKTAINPENKETQKYVVQYNESSYAFITRLSERYGEWFFYDGQQQIFGKYSPQKITLTHQIDLLDFNIALSVLPNNAKLNGYDYRQDKVVEDTTQSKETGKLNTYSQHASDISSKLYNREGLYKMNYAFNSSAKSQMDKLATLQKKGRLAKMVTLKGSSTNPAVRIGDTVSIKESFSGQEQHHGEFMITGVRHYCGANGSYHNMFEGIPADAAAPHINLANIPYTEPQSAVVTDNNDPKGLGRIRVRFRWMQQGQTPWIRVVSASGGGDKGMFIMPEVGEEVITEFEGGNPEQPFVMGATYNGGAKSSYGNAGNDMKALKTRSGNTILLNDATGSITVTDKNGSSMAMDGAGNITVSSQTLITVKTEDHIVVEAPNKIELKSKEIHLIGSEKVFIGEQNASMLIDNAANNIASGAKTIISAADDANFVTSKSNLYIDSKNLFAAGEQVVNIGSEKGNVKVNGKITTDIVGGMLNLNC
ncbi:type VI secretion system Vgr family protein [Chitinophaga sp. S165]|uniref:type VI secretion system Vgr family protein n=1 Tax=Chitinophaga sp. S165 TaxID=2135462 RepID=UPI000D71AB20|nr:phage baseplate assembly protein V [Chitinophaga sp. S165]PWV49762.1 Rhs element Vgr protein [Chitinophaga sp. S165]